MNIKKEVVKRITDLLQNELTRCNNKLSDNKYQFKKLVEQQTILKRERVKLTEMLRDLKTGLESKK